MLKKQVMVKEIEKKYDHPLAEIVQIASQYKSEVLLEYDKYKINAKSIMGMMSLRLQKGECITVVAEGNDETEAVAGIEDFLVAGN